MRILKRLPHESGRDYALRTIEDNIVRLELPPGAPISENELASQLGLSRTPVREALIALSKERVVETAPQKCTVVAPIDRNLMEQARFARCVLELAVIGEAAQLGTEQDWMKLEQNLSLQQYCLDQGPLEMFMELDNRFHEMLFTIAHKEQIYAMLHHMTIHLDRLRNLSLPEVDNEEVLEDHRSILAALHSQQPEEAKEIMRRHLNRCRVDVVAMAQQYPTYFSPET